MPQPAKQDVTPATPETPETPAKEVQLSETDLLKGLQKIEAEATGAQPEPEETPEPTVKPVEAKPLAKTVEEEGGEVLAKSLEISSTLKDFADTVGVHVDTLSKSFAQTLTNQNAAILAISGALEGMQKTIKALAETVAQYGDKPAAPASSKPVQTPAKEALAKGIGAGGEEREGESISKANIFEGLESLTKNAKDQEDRDRYSNALVKFEATGHLADSMLTKAIAEYRRLNQTG